MLLTEVLRRLIWTSFSMVDHLVHHSRLDAEAGAGHSGMLHAICAGGEEGSPEHGEESVCSFRPVFFSWALAPSPGAPVKVPEEALRVEGQKVRAPRCRHPRQVVLRRVFQRFAAVCTAPMPTSAE